MSLHVVVGRSQGCAQRLEALEGRILFSFDPSGREQESLELLNRMRLNPQAELDLLLNADDPHIDSALNYFNVSIDVLRQQWAALTAVPPLAWNEDLSEAALFHTEQMRDADLQSHRVPAEEGVRPQEPVLRDRANTAGYTSQSTLGENVFAYVKSMLHAHAAYAIDWGDDTDGIQSPPGHRNTIMNDAFREVGISVLDTLPGNDTGPMLQTQDFGGPVNYGDSFLLGVAYTDLNEDGRYNANEGLDDVDLDIVGSGGFFETTTMTAGGYQIRLPEGTYTVTARGGGLPKPMKFEDVVIDDDENRKLDFIVDASVEEPGDTDPPIANLDADSTPRLGRIRYRFDVRFTDDELLNVSTLGDRDVRVTGPDNFRQYARLIDVDNATNGAQRTATYEITPPDEFWDTADNGIYEVFIRDGQVADTSGNFVAADKLGEFLVDLDAADAPTGELVANRLRQGGEALYAFKVIYRDDSAIDVSDLGDNDLRILGPNGFTANARLTRTNSNTDGGKRIGYYTLDAPGARWDARDTGRYKVYVRAHSVSDDSSNFVAPTRIGSITVNIENASAATSIRQAVTAPPPTSVFSKTLLHGPLGGVEAVERSSLSAWEALWADDSDRLA